MRHLVGSDSWYLFVALFGEVAPEDDEPVGDERPLVQLGDQIGFGHESAPGDLVLLLAGPYGVALAVRNVGHFVDGVFECLELCTARIHPVIDLI